MVEFPSSSLEALGKSTLVNRIAQTGDAIVHEMRGVTRDRSYHKADWNGVEFMPERSLPSAARSRPRPTSRPCRCRAGRSPATGRPGEGPEEKAKIRERIEDRMTFVGYAPVVAISALTGKRVDRIWNAIDDVYANYSRTI